ncbi:uncharacterized protein NECHADRAFT_83257 [Fusarium vanettenii 77-13-4]|uniref:Enoyl reductase (ER) domain-containing protein n=1 Tax=Fusarium vanettenii (strain ATCC MYA-4622 / CBS 123669 / FGSC 9596 / NRRL 45880 / 77-13-4) TaxID=660122 RepID=C7Z3I1_FUSV7|nr:uncharacterized protein NECHADRAFT_83257 [Fusarium vanettenii 77-13-4]EEU41314.1 hypothetical protein NECHADRAFT_83257 [Fusarium vanettenii 77-13-4]
MGTLNKAIYVGPDNGLSVRDILAEYEPGQNQALVQVHYSGVNPADVKHGVLLGLNDYVCGYEFSGEVLKAGPNFRYAVSEYIYGSKRVGFGSEFGAHQGRLLVEGNTLIAKRPPSLPSHDAAAMSVVLRTAADALFNVMKIPFKPLVDGEQGAQGGILIWGGGSAVGSAAIQLAKSAGLSPIITTASSRNHGALKSMGATHCFDYSDDDVVAKIQAVLDAQSQPLVYVFDTVGSTGESASWRHCEALHCSPEMICVATVPIVGSKYKWQWCVAARGWDLPMPPPIGFTPASAEYESRIPCPQYNRH